MQICLWKYKHARENQYIKIVFYLFQVGDMLNIEECVRYYTAYNQPVDAGSKSTFQRSYEQTE